MFNKCQGVPLKFFLATISLKILCAVMPGIQPTLEI